MRGMGMCCVAFAPAAAGGRGCRSGGWRACPAGSRAARRFRSARCAAVGWPSSSTLSEPRRLPMVPSSITVHSGLATFWPMRPLKAETPLRLKSASRPWPTASCSRMPGHPGPSTTVISPAGASTASSCTMACAGGFARRNVRASSPSGRNRARTRPPPPAWPRCGAPPLSRASAETLMRASGWRSNVSTPSLVATITWRRLSAYAACTWKYARIVSAGGAVGALHQFHAFGECGLGGRCQHRIQIVPARLPRDRTCPPWPGPRAMRAATRAALRIFSGLRSSL